jgi:Uma2 family endonuclease
MTALTKPRMTVGEYLAWAEGQPGRHELVNGIVHAMSPEGAGHAEKKAAVYTALLAEISRAPNTLPRASRWHDGAHR